MTRIKGGPRAHRKHKKVLSATKGYRGTRRKLFKRAQEAYLHAGQHAYVGRRLRRRDIRRLWIIRINAILKENGLTYSKFISLLKDAKIELDRKVLAQLAIEDPDVFKKIIEKATGKVSETGSKSSKTQSPKTKP